MNTFAQISNEQIRVANQIFVEHKNQKKKIDVQEKQIINLQGQTSVLTDKNANLEKKYEIKEQQYNTEKKANKRLTIVAILLTALSVFLGVKK